MIDRLKQSGFLHVQSAQLRSKRQQYLNYWRGLADRERLAVTVAALALLATVLWFGFIKPPLQRIEHWQSELPRLHNESLALDEILQDISPAQAPTGIADADPARQISQSLDAQSLASHYQLHQQQDQAAVELEFSAAPAGPLMAWLQHTAPRLSLHISEAHLQRTLTSDPAVSGVTLSGGVRLEPMSNSGGSR
ncbi:MAG: general secretion pathway protein GspM [Rhodobacteraceae bacterium]|nr:general secretion pathway protein GspM [Paracoccaceae bacterium]